MAVEVYQKYFHISYKLIVFRNMKPPLTLKLQDM